MSQIEVVDGRAVVTASVTNAGAEADRIVLGAFAPAGAAGALSALAWTTVDQPLRELEPGATEQYSITLAPPPATPAGRYQVRFIAYSADSAPEENADQASQLEVVVAGSAAPVAAKRPWWIFAAAGALVLVVAVVAFLVIPRPAPAPTPTPTPVPPSTPPSSSSPSPLGVVEAFSLPDFATESQGVPGATQSLPVGRYDDVDGALTVGNDQISSLRVPRGLVVRAWEHAWFQGEFVDFIQDTPAMPAGWDDRISSLIVFESADGPPRIEYAVGLDYLWAHWHVLPVGDYPDLGRTPLGAYTMSAILVPRGVKVTIFDQVGFAGSSTEITGDLLDLAEWNDRAASLKVTLG